ITTITRLDPLWADFNVPTKYLNSVKIGQIVHINNEAFPDDTFTGKVTATEPQADSGTDSFTVRATIENPDKKLLPGQSVDVTLLTGQPTQIIAAPAIAVIYRDNKTFLYKVTNDEAKLVPVTVGEQTGQDMIITSGIQAGDTIVVDGTNKIIGDQGKISPVDVNDPSANTSATGQENTSASSSSDDTQHNKQSAKKSNSDARAP
ncbi:MAG: efflux RND transporter periplasmic adaptor subunit, partial [Pseudomonadota bacterium]